MSDEWIKECRTCVWYVGGSLEGQCHRYAPKPLIDHNSRFDAVWPRVVIDHGCGDHSDYPR
jgi:hypothetical protein